MSNEKTNTLPNADSSPELSATPGSAVGAYALPFTSTEALWNLCNDTPIDVPRFILGKMLSMVDAYCSEADLDVKTEGERAYVTPRKCTLNACGEQAINKRWASAIPQNNEVSQRGQ